MFNVILKESTCIKIEDLQMNHYDHQDSDLKVDIIIYYYWLPGT